MKLLTANTTYNVDQLAERLQMSRRTVYRYIDTFREAGVVIKKSGDCIRLDKESPHFRDISQLVHFTEEEAVILKSAIENIDDTNMLKQNLKRKLYSVYDNKTLADTVVRGKNSPNIRTLIEAIDEHRQVILHGYQSAHGGEVRDRRVEPFAFTTNYVQVWCYDPEAHACKLFKTSRIGSAELTAAPWEHEPEHCEGFIDAFRLLGGAGRLRLRGALEPVQLLCYLRVAALQLRLRAVPAAAPAAQPCAQLRVGLGVGARLLAGGSDGGDALFQLRRTRHAEAALPDERDLAGKTGVLAQLGGNEEAALLIGLTFSGVGKQNAHFSCLYDRQRVIFIDNGLPACYREDGQAVDEANSNQEVATQLDAQQGRHEPTSYFVD